MKELKEFMIDAALEENLKNAIKYLPTVPKHIDIYSEAISDIKNTTKLDQIPLIQYAAETSSSNFNNEINKIIKLLLLSRQSILPVLSEYKKFSESYRDLTSRIFNDTRLFKNKINSIISPFCYFCDILEENQSSHSNAGRIGKFITLPFFLYHTRMYNDSVSIRISSSGEVIFSNAERVLSLPLTENISIKAINESSVGVITFNIRVQKIEANAIYFKFLNNVNSASVKIYNGSTNLYSQEFQDNEVFVNFLPIEFDMISIALKIENTNTDKPLSVQLSSLEIFKSIQFSKKGTFESTHIPISSVDDISSVKIVFNNLNTSTELNTESLISLTADTDQYIFNKLYDKNSGIDIAMFKNKNTRLFSNISSVYDTEINSLDVFNRVFFKIPIQNTDLDFWNLNYKNATILHGVNSHYGIPFGGIISDKKLPYENWTKVGNYWKTMILNFEDNVTIDIGALIIKINGIEKTGEIKIPIGISEIEVHDKDIDFKLGNKKIAKENDGIMNKALVYSDPLFPFNLAYMFSGLPVYVEGTGLAEPAIVRQFTVNGTTTINLNEPFLPMSVSIEDQENEFSLQFTSTLYKEGTFLVEPNSGKIRVMPILQGEHNIFITYKRASLTRKPCGILFNRLLTFMPIKALLGMPYSDNVLFTLEGDSISKNLLLQKINNQSIEHSYILFNKQNDYLYGAVRIEMETKNKFLSPVISNIYIAGT